MVFYKISQNTTVTPLFFAYLDVLQYFLQNIKKLGTIKCEAFYVPTYLMGKFNLLI